MSVMEETLREEFEYQLNQLKRITTHGPSLGRFVEILLINLFKKYLPKSINYTSGFIKGVSINSLTSPQIDILCYDNINFPILFDIGEFKVLTAKSIKGMIEVKSTLTKKILNEILCGSTHKGFSEVPLNSYIFVISAKSQISTKRAFNAIKEFYDSKPAINKFFSAIHSLDWDEMITFNPSQNKEEIELGISRIMLHKKGLAPLFGKLMCNLYREEAFESICNNLGPSLFKVIEHTSYKLHLR